MPSYLSNIVIIKYSRNLKIKITRLNMTYIVWNVSLVPTCTFSIQWSQPAHLTRLNMIEILPRCTTRQEQWSHSKVSKSNITLRLSPTTPPKIQDLFILWVALQAKCSIPIRHLLQQQNQKENHFHKWVSRRLPILGCASQATQNKSPV